MNIVVVGAGIVGCASAYYLAERGADVTVYEKGSIGSGSTERSAGGIRSQFSSVVNVDLSLASMRVWDTFEETFDVDIARRQAGYLLLARTPELEARFEADVKMQNDRGAPTELLTPEEARECCPELRVDRYRAATYSPIDGFADPGLALRGFAQAATEAGAEIHTKTPVTDVHRDADGTVTGVTADGDRSDADFVVNAAGAWSRRVAALADISLPIAPRRRQIVITEPETSVPAEVPLTIDLDSGSYFRPEREGAAIVGGYFAPDDPDANPDGYPHNMDFDWAATAVERAAEVAGYFGDDTRIKRGWAGLYAVTPDHNAIIEETAPGFITAAGFSGHGFQHSPATGQLVTELVFDGETSLVDISALRSDRFDHDADHVEQNVA